VPRESGNLLVLRAASRSPEAEVDPPEGPRLQIGGVVGAAGEAPLEGFSLLRGEQIDHGE